MVIAVRVRLRTATFFGYARLRTAGCEGDARLRTVDYHCMSELLLGKKAKRSATSHPTSPNKLHDRQTHVKKSEKKRQPHVKKSAEYPPGIEPAPLTLRNKRMYH